jgi:hypothetical protein
MPTAVLFIRPDDGSPSPQIVFEHTVDAADDTLFLAFTYPYSYTDVQADMAAVDAAAAQAHAAVLAAPVVPDPEAIYCCRELLTRSPDGLRVDLVTIRWGGRALPLLLTHSLCPTAADFTANLRLSSPYLNRPCSPPLGRSSCRGLSSESEPSLPGLFPDPYSSPPSPYYPPEQPPTGPGAGARARVFPDKEV